MTDEPNHQELKKLKSLSNKRRTTSSIVSSDLTKHKSISQISSSFVYCDLQLEKIKVEIQERMKEQRKREEFLHSVLKPENDNFNTEMLTETNRKPEITSPVSESFSLCNSLQKFLCKCFT